MFSPLLGQAEFIEFSDDNLLEIQGPGASTQQGRSNGDRGTNDHGSWSNSARCRICINIFISAQFFSSKS